VGDQEINSYRDLKVWRDAMTLAEDCYRLTQDFPKDEVFGMTLQIRRSAASIPANIVEGHGRETTGSFIQHLRVAQGSLKELETHLLLAGRTDMISRNRIAGEIERCEAIGKMIRSLIRSLQARESVG
jgi:four helix bundle protein